MCFLYSGVAFTTFLRFCYFANNRSFLRRREAIGSSNLEWNRLPFDDLYQIDIDGGGQVEAEPFENALGFYLRFLVRANMNGSHGAMISFCVGNVNTMATWLGLPEAPRAPIGAGFL